jgi:hypothetical protein
MSSAAFAHGGHSHAALTPVETHSVAPSPADSSIQAEQVAEAAIYVSEASDSSPICHAAGCCRGAGMTCCCGAALIADGTDAPAMPHSARFAYSNAPPKRGLAPEALPKPPKSFA